MDLGGLKLSGVSSKTSIPMVPLAYLSQMDNSVAKGREGGQRAALQSRAQGLTTPGRLPLSLQPLFSQVSTYRPEHGVEKTGTHSPCAHQSHRWGHEPHRDKSHSSSLGAGPRPTFAL